MSPVTLPDVSFMSQDGPENGPVNRINVVSFYEVPALLSLSSCLLFVPRLAVAHVHADDDLLTWLRK